MQQLLLYPGQIKRRTYDLWVHLKRNDKFEVFVLFDARISPICIECFRPRGCVHTRYSYNLIKIKLSFLFLALVTCSNLSFDLSVVYLPFAFIWLVRYFDFDLELIGWRIAFERFCITACIAIAELKFVMFVCFITTCVEVKARISGFKSGFKENEIRCTEGRWVEKSAAACFIQVDW